MVLDIPQGQVILGAKFRLPALAVSWLSGLEWTSHRTQYTQGSSHLHRIVCDSGAGHSSAILSKHITEMPTLLCFPYEACYGDH